MKLIVRQQNKMTGGASGKMTKMPSTTYMSSLRRTPEQSTERLRTGGVSTESPTPPVGMIMYVPGSESDDMQSKVATYLLQSEL